ncbi:MAG: class I SAM-dependent methyltransferase [Hyphomicrobiales bacterium]
MNDMPIPLGYPVGMVGARAPLDPASLMAWVAGLPTRRRACLECGAGGGEVAGFLSRRFGRVAALNLHPRHLGPVRPPVYALCGDAAALPIATGSLDLVISVQSLHHFAVDKHLSEARRVLRKGGIFAALCWGRMRLPENIAPMYDTNGKYY